VYIWIMRAIYLLATVTIQLLLVFMLKLLDSFYFLFSIMIFGIIAGAIMMRIKNTWLKDLGWGLFAGSTVTFIAVASFTIWLYYKFPK
jgi:hypothetical protein